MLSASPPAAFAQATAGSIAGTLMDSSGALMVAMTVTITNTSTQVVREAKSDTGGRFIVPDLQPGPYSVRVAAEGFQTYVEKGIVLQIGQTLNLPVKLSLGAISDLITVTADQTQVNTTENTVAQVVDQQAIESLPLNGRDFSQLPLTTAGVTTSRNVSSSTTMGYGAKIVMAGSRPDVTAWLLDGMNIKGITNYGTPADVSGAMLGVGAIQEFQTLVVGFQADYGQTSGGVINMLTKSGTNKIHGDAYYYVRNDVFDAFNYFDLAKQPLNKNQYGGSIGGPIVKEKTFLFMNFEGIHQTQGTTRISFVPNDATRAAVTASELLPYIAAWPKANLVADSGSGLGKNSTAVLQPTSENYALGRIDHQFSPRQQIFARFNYDQGTIKQPDALPVSNYTVTVRTRYATLQYTNIITDHFLASSKIAFNRTVLLSDTALTADAKAKLLSVPDPLISTGPIMFTPWGSPMPPQLQLPGATVFSPVSTEQFLRLQNIFEGQQSFQWVKGGHTMKFGADIQQIDYNQLASGPGQFGSFTWNSIANFVKDGPLSAAQILPYTVDGHEPLQWKQFINSFWIQDNWKLRSNLTVNLGLRYEPFTLPSEKFNRYATVKDWTTDKAWLVKSAPIIPGRIAGYEASGPFWNSSSKRDFMPRLGFAWDPKGDGKMALRGGFGVFFVDILNTYYGTPGQVNAPFYGTISTTSSTPGTGLGIYNLLSSQNDVLLTGPSATSASLNAATGSKTLIAYNMRPSYELKYNLSFDRDLGKGFSMTPEIIAGRGVHLWRTTAISYAPATINNGRFYVASAATAINPFTDQGTVNAPDAQSFYNAAQITAKKRFLNRALIQLSYTYAKNIDDSTSGGVSGVGNEPSTAVPDFSKKDRARSGLFQKHTFLLNGVYPLPSTSRTRFLAVATQGWQVSGIAIMNSEQPFTVTATGNRPEITTSIPKGATTLPANFGSGSAPNGVTSNASRPDYAPNRSPENIYMHPQFPTQPYFDLAAFTVPAYGYYGNVGRNSLIGPNYVNFDGSIKRALRISERCRLEVTGDIFNLFNHRNFTIPNSVAVNDNGSAVAGAGQITSTVNNNNSSRQMQFSAKLAF